MFCLPFAHFGSLHFFTSLGLPKRSQFLPSAFGGGLVQDRTRICVPVPQVLLHLVHVVQRVYPPSIAIVSSEKLNKKDCAELNVLGT